MTDTVWKILQEEGPALLKDMITASAEAGLKGLKTGVKGKNVNWKAGLKAAKRGAKQKAREELPKSDQEKSAQKHF